MSYKNQKLENVVTAPRVGHVDGCVCVMCIAVKINKMVLIRTRHYHFDNNPIGKIMRN